MEARAEPFFARPPKDQLAPTLVLSVIFAAVFYSVYGGASWLTGRMARRFHVHFDFEPDLPFVPQAALLYLSINLMFLLVPFVFRTWREVVPLFLTLVAQTFAGGLVFLLFPVEQGYPERTAEGALSGVFHLADLLNLEYNEVPSLHVTFALTIALAFGRRGGRLARALLAVWTVAIAAAAVLMHEHHLVDLAAGAALALAGMASVHRRCRRPGFLDAVALEAICLREFARLARRHVRYAALFLVIYRYGLPRWRKTRIVRAAYCLAQHVDDVLDGDHRVERPPLDYVDDLMAVLRGEAMPSTSIGFLTRFVAAELDGVATDPMATDQERPKKELLALFEVLKRDRRRLEGRLLWPADELLEHHRQTFRHSLSLTLRLVGSPLRAGAAPGLIDALAWCSPLRDLEDDLDRGIVNVPAEVVDRARRQGVSSLAYGELVETDAVRAWIGDEYSRGRAAIAAARQELRRIDDSDPGKPVLRLLTTAIERYAVRYERRQRDRLGSALAQPAVGTALVESEP